MGAFHQPYPGLALQIASCSHQPRAEIGYAVMIAQGWIEIGYDIRLKDLNLEVRSRLPKNESTNLLMKDSLVGLREMD